MQISEHEGSSLSGVPGVAATDTNMLEANEQELPVEQENRPHADPESTVFPREKPPPNREDQASNVTETAGLNSFHRVPGDVQENLPQAQNSESDSGKNEAIIKDLKARLEQYKIQSDIDAANAKETENELKDSRAKYKNLVKELNKAKVQGQSHMIHHVTDSELSKKVQQLRYNIFNLTAQYFGNDASTVKTLQHSQEWIHVLEPSLTCLGMELNEFLNLMHPQSSRRISVVQALIWAKLCETLFGKFAWTSDQAANAIGNIKKDLLLEKNVTSKEDRLQAWRRWHTWRATTSIVLLECSAAEAGDRQSRQEEFYDQIMNSLVDILKPFAGTGHDTFAIGLGEIVQDAMELDKVMNKQVPALRWIHKLKQLPEEYSPEQMEFDSGNQPEKSPREDWLIVNPGLQKRGKSTGQDFDQVVVLSKTTFIDKFGAFDSDFMEQTSKS